MTDTLVECTGWQRSNASLFLSIKDKITALGPLQPKKHITLMLAQEDIRLAAITQT